MVYVGITLSFNLLFIFHLYDFSVLLEPESGKGVCTTAVGTNIKRYIGAFVGCISWFRKKG